MQLLDNEILNQSIRVSDVDGNIQRLPRGHSTEWRVLPFFMYSQASEGSECLHLEGGIKKTAKEGEMIVLPAGVRHKVDVVGNEQVRRWVHVNYSLFNNLDLFSLLETPVIIRGELGRQIGTVIEEWVAAEAMHRRENVLQRNARRHEMGFTLLRLLTTVCRPRPDALYRMDQVRAFAPVTEYMHNHFDKPLGRDALAQLAGLSPAQFHLNFKKATGASPMAFLKGIRLRHAQQLLIGTNTPVKQVAARCGYEDPFVFSKFFKRECGLSPNSYRQRVRASYHP